MNRPATQSALVAGALIASLLAGCASQAEVVNVGGAKTETVQRPWGTVKTFPQVEKAEIPTADDLEFTRHMIVHHQQAIELSDLVLQHDELDERVTASAEFIRQDQTREIKAMQLWLDAWEATPGVLPHHASHSSHAKDETSQMPGMVAAGKIAALEKLDAPEAQREFTELMIFHHQGAVEMSHDFIKVGENAFSLNVARHLIREQKLEITYLTRLGDDL